MCRCYRAAPEDLAHRVEVDAQAQHDARAQVPQVVEVHVSMRVDTRPNAKSFGQLDLSLKSAVTGRNCTFRPLPGIYLGGHLFCP